MRPDETRSFDDRALDVENAEQVRDWAERLEVSEADLLAACAEVGSNRTAVELKLAAPRT